MKRVEILSSDGTKMVSLTKRKAIRERCVNCSGWNHKQVKNCWAKDCSLYPYRMSEMPKHGSRKRDKAIKDYCAWCVNGVHEIKKCVSTLCPLFYFRSYSI